MQARTTDAATSGSMTSPRAKLAANGSGRPWDRSTRSSPSSTAAMTAGQTRRRVSSSDATLMPAEGKMADTAEAPKKFAEKMAPAT